MISLREFYILYISLCLNTTARFCSFLDGSPPCAVQSCLAALLNRSTNGIRRGLFSRQKKWLGAILHREHDDKSWDFGVPHFNSKPFIHVFKCDSFKRKLCLENIWYMENCHSHWDTCGRCYVCNNMYCNNHHTK